MHFVHDRRPIRQAQGRPPTADRYSLTKVYDSAGIEGQRWEPENSPLLLCPPAPLLIILALFWLTALTACTGSSAATEPSETAGNLPTRSTQVESSPESPTLAPSPQPLPTHIPEPTPTPTSTPTPSPTPAPRPSLRQLTSGGCCVQPSFSFDSQQVLYIDKPSADMSSGIYGVNLADLQPTSVLVNSVIGFRNLDGTIVATPDGELTLFTNEVSGESWTVNTGGNWPSFSPDSRQIIWTATDQEGPYDRRQSDVWLANIPPSPPLAGGAGGGRLVLSLYGGGLAGWFPDSQRILLIGRDNPNEEKQTLFVYDLINDRRTNLFTHKRLRGGEISRGGSWIAFFLSFADEPTENGLWVISADGTTRRQLDLPRFGAYLWRDDNTLLFIPMRAPDEASMQLWAIDAPTGQLQPLTDPASLSFSISNGDWEVSPDGRHVVFVNSADRNIWLITLP